MEDDFNLANLSFTWAWHSSAPAFLFHFFFLADFSDLSTLIFNSDFFLSSSRIFVTFSTVVTGCAFPPYLDEQVLASFAVDIFFHGMLESIWVPKLIDMYWGRENTQKNTNRSLLSWNFLITGKLLEFLIIGQQVMIPSTRSRTPNLKVRMVRSDFHPKILQFCQNLQLSSTSRSTSKPN